MLMRQDKHPEHFYPPILRYFERTHFLEMRIPSSNFVLFPLITLQRLRSVSKTPPEMAPKKMYPRSLLWR